MARTEHYMLTTHPIELHKAANLESAGSRLRNSLAETRSDLRANKLLTKAAGLLTGACFAGAAYEIVDNLNEGRAFAAAMAISAVATLVGMRASTVLEQREAMLTQHLQAHESHVAEYSEASFVPSELV